MPGPPSIWVDQGTARAGCGLCGTHRRYGGRMVQRWGKLVAFDMPVSLKFARPFRRKPFFGTLMEIEKFLIAAQDGCPLFMLRASGEDRSGPVVLLGHGPSVHSRLLMPCIRAFTAAGAVVWAGDLRGHGGSISERAPKAHLDPATGWAGLVADMNCFAKLAFKDVPEARRLMIGGGLSGHVMLDALAQDDKLARHLVMAGPTAPQRGVSKVLEGFLRVRQLTRPRDAPDPQFLHHIYGFLRAHLSEEAELADTISADRARVDEVLADPNGFPTPTLGYWQSILPGIQAAWHDRAGVQVLRPDLRVLVLTGPQDPQTRGGKLVPIIIDSFAARGVQDVRAVLLDQVRANILIDAETVPMVPHVLDWFAEESAVPKRDGAKVLPAQDAREPYLPAMARLNISAPDSEIRLPQLIDLCYSAIHDDARWIEMIYCLCLAAEDGGDNLDEVLDNLHPHWQRAFQLREDLRWAAGMGHIYNDLIDRLDLGVAVLDTDLCLRHANPAFKRAICRLMGATEDTMARSTAQLLAQQGRVTQTGSGGEQPILHDGHVIGVSFVPKGMSGVAERSSPIGRLLVIRDPEDQSRNLSYRAKLLTLAYGLTDKESQVAILLADGQSTRDAADMLSITEHTLRSHIKQIFDKLQITRRGELSQLILSGPIGWIAAPEIRATDPRNVAPSQANLTTSRRLPRT